MSLRNYRASRGFTLVEVLSALAIIAIMLGVGIKILNGVTDSAKVTAAQKIEDDLNAVIQQKILAGATNPCFYATGSTYGGSSPSYLCPAFVAYLYTNIGYLPLFSTAPQFSYLNPTETPMSSGILANAQGLMTPAFLSNYSTYSSPTPWTNNYYISAYFTTGVFMQQNLPVVSKTLGNQSTTIVWFKLAQAQFDFGYDRSFGSGGFPSGAAFVTHIYVRPTAWPTY